MPGSAERRYVRDKQRELPVEEGVGPMNGKKGNNMNLVEQIRDMVEKSREHDNYPTFNANCLVDDHCESSEEFERELFTVIADRIEREYIPRPRFEDGDIVDVGDMVRWSDEKSKRVESFAVCTNLEGCCGINGNVLRRPLTEVLDADGVPIEVGDVVWFVGGSEYFYVLGIESDGEVHVGRNDGTSTDAGVSPGDLTHKKPDTLERIEEDARKELWHYWGCSGAGCDECPALIDGKTPEEHYHTGSCADAKVLDLLHRQRKVLDRGQA